ncbi:MAG TPA: hypothetical protein PK718_00960 [Candidatus Methanofastidiosa archaeon]|nr:hypothetical protein [Candidatus Methanofastidiosa archaeon]HPR41102.1 hypothetical protein [Candidatus Methanofastidiosa archaeon]
MTGTSPKKKEKKLPEEFIPVLMKHAKKHMLEEEKKGIFRKLPIK